MRHLSGPDADALRSLHQLLPCPTFILLKRAISRERWGPRKARRTWTSQRVTTAIDIVHDTVGFIKPTASAWKFDTSSL
jgi:hypothetical protein